MPRMICRPIWLPMLLAALLTMASIGDWRVLRLFGVVDFLLFSSSAAAAIFSALAFNIS